MYTVCSVLYMCVCVCVQQAFVRVWVCGVVFRGVCVSLVCVCVCVYVCVGGWVGVWVGVSLYPVLKRVLTLMCLDIWMGLYILYDLPGRSVR